MGYFGAGISVSQTLSDLISEVIVVLIFSYVLVMPCHHH